MPKMTCPMCGKEIGYRDEYAGRKAKCPECGELVTLGKLPAEITPEPRVRRRAPVSNLVIALDVCGAFLILAGLGGCLEASYDSVHGPVLFFGGTLTFIGALLLWSAARMIQLLANIAERD